MARDVGREDIGLSLRDFSWITSRSGAPPSWETYLMECLKDGIPLFLIVREWLSWLRQRWNNYLFFSTARRPWTTNRRLAFWAFFVHRESILFSNFGTGNIVGEPLDLSKEPLGEPDTTKNLAWSGFLNMLALWAHHVRTRNYKIAMGGNGGVVKSNMRVGPDRTASGERFYPNLARIMNKWTIGGEPS